MPPSTYTAGRRDANRRVSSRRASHFSTEVNPHQTEQQSLKNPREIRNKIAKT